MTLKQLSYLNINFIQRYFDMNNIPQVAAVRHRYNGEKRVVKDKHISHVIRKAGNTLHGIFVNTL